MDCMSASLAAAAQGAVVVEGALARGQRRGLPAQASDLLAQAGLLARVVLEGGEAHQDVDAAEAGDAELAGASRVAGVEVADEGVEQAVGGGVVAVGAQPGANVREELARDLVVADGEHRELQGGGGADQIRGEAGEAAVEAGELGVAVAGGPAQRADQAVQGGDAGRIAGDGELELAAALVGIGEEAGEVELADGAQAREVEAGDVLLEQRAQGLALAAAEHRLEHEGHGDRVVGDELEGGAVAGEGAIDVGAVLLAALAVLDPRRGAQGRGLGRVGGLAGELIEVVGEAVARERGGARGAGARGRAARGEQALAEVATAELLQVDATCLSGHG